MTPLLSVRAVAERLNVSQKTVYKLIDQRKLGSLKIGGAVRVRPDALEAFLTATERPVVEQPTSDTPQPARKRPSTVSPSSLRFEHMRP